MADAVLDELASGQTCLALCMSREGSATLERLIRVLPQPHLFRIFTELTGAAWTWLLCNPYASHVFDTCVRVIADLRDRPAISALAEVAGQLVSQADWPTITQSNYASQSLKHLLRALNGQTDAKLEKLRRKVSNVVVQGCDCAQLSLLPFGSSLLQFIIQEESHAATASFAQEMPCWKALYSLFSAAPEDWDKACKNQSQSRLVEELVAISGRLPEKTAALATIYSSLFRGKLVALCSHPVANFVVQRLIDACSSAPLANLLFGELKEAFPSLFRGRTGVVSKLAQKAAQFGEIQRDFVKSLVSGLVSLESTGKDATDDAKAADVRNRLVTVLLRFKNAPKHTFKQRRGKESAEMLFSPLGCAVLECLVSFQHDLVKFVSKGLLALDPSTELVPMAKDSSASRVFEQLLLAPSVPVQTKQQLIDKLKGYYGALSLDRAGSHVVEKCYAAAELSRKESITAELVAVEPQLKNLQHGKFVIQSCRVLQYKEKADVWRAAETGASKKAAMFADILTDAPSDQGVSSEPLSKESTRADPWMASLGFGKADTTKKRKRISPEDDGAKRQKIHEADDVMEGLSSTLVAAISGSREKSGKKKDKSSRKEKGPY